MRNFQIRWLLLSFWLVNCFAAYPQSSYKVSDLLNFQIVTNPFSLNIQQGKHSPIARMGGDERAGLFFVTGQDTQYITAPSHVITEKTGHFRAVYRTTDKRRAYVYVRQLGNGSISLQFTVSPREGVRRKGVILEASQGEAYYGLMERTVDGPQERSWAPGIKRGLNLRGQRLTMFIKPTLSIYTPMFVSSKGYGVYVHGSWPGEYDLAATRADRVSFSFEGPRLQVTLIPGPAPIDVVKRFNAMVGPPVMPPPWTFEVFHWRDEHQQRETFYEGTRNTGPFNTDLTEDILMLDALDIPNRVYWIDRPWALGPEGYSDFKWDRKRFPNAEQMVEWIHRRGRKLLLWIAPWVMGEEMFSEAKEKGFLVPQSRETALLNPDNVRQLLDYSNPEAVDWWGSYVKRVLDDGIDGYKMDRSEEMMPDYRDVYMDSGKNTRELHNKYPFLYVKGTHEVTQKYRPDGDFLLMPRAAYTQSRKYGVFWGGDIASGPRGLRAALIAAQRAAFMGFPVWGSDTGGYWGEEEHFSRENISRWLAFSCFTPIMEVGPLRNRAVWDMPGEPAYDTELIAIYRLYAMIHTRMNNYTYGMARRAHETGEPVIRPLAMAFPEDKTAAARWDEYLYGRDILVGIIWKNGQRTFRMYLPEGTWKDAWTDKVYKGPATVTLECPLYKIPIFIRGESKMDLGNLKQIYHQSLNIARAKPDMMKLLEQMKAELKK